MQSIWTTIHEYSADQTLVTNFWKLKRHCFYRFLEESFYCMWSMCKYWDIVSKTIYETR